MSLHTPEEFGQRAAGSLGRDDAEVQLYATLAVASAIERLAKAVERLADAHKSPPSASAPPRPGR